MAHPNGMVGRASKRAKVWPSDITRMIIIGCGGFVGSHLLDYVLEYDEVQVEGLDPSDRKIAQHVGKPNFNLTRKILTDPGVFEDLEEKISQADVVINLAAICNPAEYNTDPIAVIRSNFLDCYRLAEICAKHKTWLMHFSTSEVYGRTISSYISGHNYADPELYELDEDTTPLIMGPIANQRWTYACAKQLMERYVFAHHKDYGLPYTIIRPLNFFGPRMDYIPGRDGEGVPRVLASFMKALLDREPMMLVDGGSVRRTIVSIRDAVRAIVLALQQPERAQNQIFNIGNRNNEVTIAELAHLMRRTYAEITGDASYNDHPIRSISSAEFYGAGYEDCDRRMPRVDKAKELLGWEAVIPLEEAVHETMSYYHQQYGVK